MVVGTNMISIDINGLDVPWRTRADSPVCGGGVGIKKSQTGTDIGRERGESVKAGKQIRDNFRV